MPALDARFGVIAPHQQCVGNPIHNLDGGGSNPPARSSATDALTIRLSVPAIWMVAWDPFISAAVRFNPSVLIGYMTNAVR